MAKSKTAAPVETEMPQERRAGGKITKSEAARRAIAAGFEQPTDASAYIKSEFGLDMTPQHFSAVKSQMKSKLGTVTIRAKTESRGGRGVQGAGDLGEGDLLSAMEALKPLVASLGVDKVKRLADLLG